MLRIYCDFNDEEPGDRYFNLWYGDAPLEGQKDALKLVDGQRVLLFQDEGDFEVEANLRFGQAGRLLGKTVCAELDRSTFRRI